LPGKRRLQSTIAIATTVCFEYFRKAVPDGGILTCQTYPCAVVKVGAPGNLQLGEEFWQAIAIFKGVNQLCLFPIAQDLQIDAQAFF
jgi:hypothetical protein